MRFLVACLCLLVSSSVFAKKEVPVLEPIKKSNIPTWPEKGKVDIEGCGVLPQAFADFIKNENREISEGFQLFITTQVCIKGQLHLRVELRRGGRIYIDSYQKVYFEKCIDYTCTIVRNTVDFQEFDPPKSMPL